MRPIATLPLVPVVTPEKCLEMYKSARHRGFAYPAINVTSSSTVLAKTRGMCPSLPGLSWRKWLTVDEIHETLGYGVIKMSIHTNRQYPIPGQFSIT